MEREIQGMQAGFTSLSSDSTHRVIEGSTHVSLVVQQSHAKQTSAEILRVVDAVRTGRTLGSNHRGEGQANDPGPTDARQDVARRWRDAC